MGTLPQPLSGVGMAVRKQRVGPNSSSCLPRVNRTPVRCGVRNAVLPRSKLLVGGVPVARTGIWKEGKRGRAQVQCNMVQKVNASELDSLLKDREFPLVIDFYATWCGPCILLAQQLEQLAVEYHGTVQFVKVDTDEEYQLATQLEIRGLPTLVFVSKDKEKLAKRCEGVLPVETLKELIDEL